MSSRSERGCFVAPCVCVHVFVCVRMPIRRFQVKTLIRSIDRAICIAPRHSKVPPIAETAPESEALGVAGRTKQMG